MPIPIANIAQAGLGLYQTIGGFQGLNNLDQYPEFAESPELRNSYNRAEQFAQRGYSPEETSAFRQNLAGQSSQRYKRAVDQSGGGLAGAVQAGLNYGNTGALINFASDDASLHRRNISYADSIMRQIQLQKNLITQGQQQRYGQVEGAYGNMLTKGLENIVNPLNLTQALGWGNKGMNNQNTTAVPQPYQWHTKQQSATPNVDWSHPYGNFDTSTQFQVPQYDGFSQYGILPTSRPPYQSYYQ